MVSFTSALVLFTTFAATATHVAANPNGVLNDLVARQNFDPSAIPQQCQDQCSSLLNSITAPSCSDDLKCICGSDIAKKTQQCAQCDASVIGQDGAESLYQKYADACKAGGITVPSFTSSGSSSGGSGSGGSGGSNSGGSSGNSGTNSKAADGAYTNLQMSAAGVVGSAALAFMLAA